MRFRKFLMMMLCCVALAYGCAGCDEEQLIQADRVAETTIGVTEQGDAILNSPVGFMIPPEIVMYVKLGGALIAGAAAQWLRQRRKDKKTN